MKRVLITGGAGFLGAWIVKRLVGRGIEPSVFDISPERAIVASIAGAAANDMEWVVGDIRSGTDVLHAAEGCDGIIHLAGVLTPACRIDPLRGAEVNLIGTLNVFAAAQRYGLSPVVYASSAGVYGPDDPVNPLPGTHYGAFKLACEGCARAYWDDVRLASAGFRPYVVYGPGREVGASAGISLACRAAARGESYVAPFTGACGLVYVDDAAAAFEHALMSPASGANVYNLVGEVASVETALDEIRLQVPGAMLDARGAALPIASGIDEAALDDWFAERPKTSLADGIKATIEHYRK
ncbi:MAG: NAD-dependent epimerase/dehydratase family protein [Gammaproteobacteria bacterium]